MSNNYEPELHSCGQSSPYIDPDYGALLSTDQLPSLSTIGRGPRGFGLFANANETTDGYFTFDIVSDVTGESILTSPNLHSGVISVKQRPDDLVPGTSSFLDITVTRGQDVATYEVELPTGSDGGRVYLWNGAKEKHPSWTYRIPTDELHFDGEAVWPSKPDPRPNDIVMMTIKDAHKYYLAVAHVVDNVGLDTIVTATTFCPVPVPYIGDNGHWYVDGEDTGVEAQGPKGDIGDRGPIGPQGSQGIQGPQGPIGPSGPVGPKGDQGDSGSNGADATIAVGDVATGEPGTDVVVTNTGTSSAAIFDFAIPRGATGATGLQGIQGVQGETGLTGPQGLKGDTGPQGAAATVDVGVVITGGAGTAASVVNSGTAGAAVFDFTIPRGNTGQTGQAATIAIGETSTLPAGSEAVVTNSGSTTAAIFDFAIPRGDKGDKGDVGPQGVMSLAEGSVHTEHLADGAVTTEKIADKGVTLSKLGDDVLARTDINEIARQLASMMSIKDDGTLVINTTD